MVAPRLPFQRTPQNPPHPERYDPAVPLAALADEIARGKGADAGAKVLTPTPWGEIAVEVRGEGVLVAATPRAVVKLPSVMLAIAATKLGVPRATIETTGTPIQVLDVGRDILVVPVEDAAAVEQAPAAPELAGIPGVDVSEAILYARTQRTPYLKVLGRLWGEAEPLTALAAAAMHLVVNQGARASYPRTRVVGELVGHDGERAEISLQLKSVGGRPKAEALYVGGKVGAAGKG